MEYAENQKGRRVSQLLTIADKWGMGVQTPQKMADISEKSHTKDGITGALLPYDSPPLPKKSALFASLKSPLNV